ncbi:hypothetical protein [Pseudomonas donghuensis]|uniref:hypothetical protein n=1 Tax=Pseudomonas donghuensis TaxID=1163398 RepID=UPI0020C2FC36|nr:hypothetical protein [Pseudomonas donghuensis]MCP6700049.1 hypothetical protein [Pseudomonas donghuensis]UVL22959.1 hypothetical protein LOY30_19230 [Pseudomonas donghuensis]
MKVRTSQLATLLLVATFALTGVKTFAAWPQVMELWGQHATPAMLTGHPHLFRYLVAYPGLWLEGNYPGLGFTLYASVFVLLNASLWSGILRKVNLSSPAVITWFIFFAAHFFMNGRGVIAWTAWLLCVSLCLDLSRIATPIRLPVLRGALACFLATVSTGIFIVVLVAITLFLISRWRAGGIRVRRWKGLFFLVLLMPCIYVFASYFIVAVEKNLDFYGGGIQGVLNMLEHGFGRVFFSAGGLGIILALLALPVGMVVAVAIMFGAPIRPTRKLLIIAVGGGLFGFTVLTLAIPLVLCELDGAKRRFARFIGLRDTLQNV